MTNDDAGDWGAEERAALADLARDTAPPAGAEDRTVAALRHGGLIGGRRRATRAWLAGGAAVAAAFVAGLAIGRPAAPGPEDARPQYVVLLYDGATGSASEEAREVGEIKAWARDLAQRGNALSGAKLADAEYLLGAGAGGTAGLGGYIVLAASDAEQALAMARTCPHLRHGGRIVVRPVDPT